MSTLIEAPSETKHSATAATFDLWAEVYDAQINPFLSLEERIISSLLPNLQGLDVLDAGCGTGRTLGLLKARNARTVIGVDNSHSMLERARSTHGIDVRHGLCTALPVPDASVDCVTCSFVISYISDLERFADELLRATRPGARIWLSDVHPETAQTLNWKRSFRWSGQEIEVASEGWSINQILSAFAARGFRVSICVEPSFASPEQDIFAQARKARSFAAMKDFPAIYVLELVREATPNIAAQFAFINARCSFTPFDAAPAPLKACDDKIEQLDSRSHQQSPCEISTLDLSGYVILPGLINAHDHLEFGLFPRIGRGNYANAEQWAEDIHREDAAMIALHRSIPRDVRIAWGAIRNLLAGVTTVCHHNPLTPAMLDPDFPVCALQNFEWAHSLAVDGDVRTKFKTSTADQPFIIHAGEGIDEASAQEFARLLEQRAIQRRTVLIHGLAIPPDSIAKINKRGAAVVICPSSNEFLFGCVPALELLLSIAKLALGSDSPLTATGDLLDELRFAFDRVGLREDELYRMVTSAPAQILRLKRGEGGLVPGSTADFIATQDRGISPAATLAKMSSQDVELVVRAGRIFLASDTIFQRLHQTARAGLELLVVDGERRWIRAPLARLFREAAPVMSDGVLFLAGKKVTHGHAA
jgi:cytosine/adenosine deaminase-related metal-dependent hydrolase/ubiquinone/menaquinone biosynthesis C-methylase UbiE